MDEVRNPVLPLLLAARLLAPGLAGAAVIHLREGGRLEGEVLRSDARETVVRTGAGPVAVDAWRIDRIEYDPPPRPAPPPPPRRTAEELFGPRRNSFALDMGLIAPLSDVEFGSAGGGRASNGDVGPRLGLQYMRLPGGRWSAGFEARYAHRGGTDSPGLLPAADSSVSGDALILMPVVKLAVRGEGTARPFILLGAGAHRTSTVVDAAPLAGFVWSDTSTSEARRLVDDSSWGAAASARVGVDFELGDPSFFSIETGWTGLFGADYAPTRAGADLGVSPASRTIHALTLAGRWGWRF